MSEKTTRYQVNPGDGDYQPVNCKRGILQINLSDLLERHQLPTLLYSLVELLEGKKSLGWCKTILHLESAEFEGTRYE